MDNPNSGLNGQEMSSQFSYQLDPVTRVHDFYLSQEEPFNFVQPLPSSTVLPPEPDAASQPAPLSDYGELQNVGDSTYGTISGGQNWYPSQSLHGGTVSSMSTVGALAADMSHLRVPYAQSEAGSSSRRPGARHKRRRISRQTTVATLNSSAGPRTVNDVHSIGATSEHGEDALAKYAVDLEDGFMQCTICSVKKKPRCEMIKHINTHTKPFNCSFTFCKHNNFPGGFATRSDLERHEITHTDTMHLAQAYVCQHEKCQKKNKLWKRWDNLKTHLRDVHNIAEAAKEDYRKIHDATHDQDLAGMGIHQFQDAPTAAPMVPGSFLEDFNSETMAMDEFGAPSQYQQSQENTKQFIDELSQIYKAPPRLEMPHLGNATTAATTTTAAAPLVHNATFSPSSISNNQEQMGLCSAVIHQQSVCSGHSHMLQGTLGFMFQPQSDTPLRGMPCQSMPFRGSSQSIVSPSSSFHTSQTTHSLNGTNQVLSSTVGQRPASSSRHVMQPQPPQNDNLSMWMTESSLVSSVVPSQDTEMRDAGFFKTCSVQSANRVEEIDTVDADADADADADVDADGVESGMGEQDADGSTHSKSVEGVGGDYDESGVISISDDGGDSPDRQSETPSQPKSPTSHRVSFAEPPSAAINEPQVAHNDDKDDGDEEEIELGVPNEDISQPVQRPGATPTVGIDQLLNHLKNYSPQDMSRFLEGANQLEALKNSGYEIRAPAQSSTHSRSVRSAQTGPSEGGDGKMYPCPAENCKASFLSSSGLKKHELRHTQPFGCTHGCSSKNKPKTFGSKNDWKRHEESIHFTHALPSMTWQCSETTADKKKCGQVFGEAKIFQQHLVDRHGDKDKLTKPVLEKVAKCRFIPAKEARYWCGFCRQMLTDGTGTPSSSSAAVAAATASASSSTESCPTVPYSQLLTSRFNHIDNHFVGRNCGQESIDDWVTQEQHRQKMEMLASQSQAQSQPGPSRPKGSHKRPTRRDQPAASRQDESKRSDVFWICCRCDNMGSPINSNTCYDCGEQFCENCQSFKPSLLDSQDR